MSQDQVITNPAQADAPWLTDALRASGDLQTGTVAAVECAGEGSMHATTARLLIHYSQDATGALPRSLFLKICKEESAAYFGRTELDLYTMIGAPLENGPIPRCYHQRYDDTSGRYHLLLEDLSETHHSNRGVMPTLESACGAAAGLATMHAYWWDHPGLQTDERYPTAAVIRRYRAQIDQGYLPMLAYLGDRISDEQRGILARVFGRHEQRMVERAAEGRHLTIIHGDTNPGNILSPNDPGAKTYVIDRQLFPSSLGVWLGVSDLAYMMAHWWPTETRLALQQPVLQTYHATLLQKGVRDYGWEKLWDDYRLSAVQSIYVAVDWCSDAEDITGMEWNWWAQLQKSLAAFGDLRCAELVN